MSSHYFPKKAMLWSACVAAAYTLAAAPAWADDCTSVPGGPASFAAGGGTASSATTVPPATSGSLAFTGAAPAHALLLGFAAVAVGGVLVLATHRRRHPDSGSLGLIGAGLVISHFAVVADPVTGAACTPAAVLPETPYAFLIPVIAVLLIAGGVIVAVRRRSS